MTNLNVGYRWRKERYKYWTWKNKVSAVENVLVLEVSIEEKETQELEIKDGVDKTLNCITPCVTIL